ncbi:MAG TPA: hypothetical protein VFH48_10380 [Chloroflexota bacterium]|nr:hypothetical protein [Chloroflexota bacterium]
MRRVIFSALFAAIAIVWTGVGSPALAHDPGFTAASDDEKGKGQRAEAAQLTDELKAAATRPIKLPAVQAAVAGRAERRRELIGQLATTNPAAVLELALTHAEKDALPSNVRSAVKWLGSRKQIASNGGSYTIFPYEDGAANTKILMVPRTRDASGNVVGYYYLEYRKPTANWTSFTSGRPEYADGVLVHASGVGALCLGCSPDFLGSGGGGDSHIVDTQPASIGGTSDFNDAPLAETQSPSPSRTTGRSRRRPFTRSWTAPRPRARPGEPTVRSRPRPRFSRARP